MIIWFTGQPGSGKTTLSNELIKLINNSTCISIDGDEIRDIFNNKDYSRDGRIKNIEMVQNFAIFLETKGFTPIVSLVSPYREIRENLKLKTKVLEIYVYSNEPRGRENFFVKDYEEPLKNFTEINTTNKSIEESGYEIFNVYRKMAAVA